MALIERRTRIDAQGHQHEGWHDAFNAAGMAVYKVAIAGLVVGVVSAMSGAAIWAGAIEQLDTTKESVGREVFTGGLYVSGFSLLGLFLAHRILMLDPSYRLRLEHQMPGHWHPDTPGPDDPYGHTKGEHAGRYY